MSMNENDPPAQSEAKSTDDHSDIGADEEDEDAAMKMALQMSMQPDAVEEAKTEQFQDPQFVSQLLGSLPGVDPNDPLIQNALRNLNAGEKKDESKDESKDQSK